MTPLPDTPLVGVTGASGAVGTAAARFLRGLGHARLRLGGRRHAPLADLARELGPGAEAVTVDVEDPAALASFAAGCAVVLNCAGPSYRIVDRVARAALDAGAHYVDVTGDAPVRRRFDADPPRPGRAVVLSAGVLPGLSALLPRWAALRGPGLRSVVAYCGGLERCTPAAAGDLLLSLPGADPAAVFGEPLAAWRDGRRVSRALRAVDEAQPPFFPAPAFVQPFLTDEAARLAASLGLAELEWYNVHPGPRARSVLTAVAGRPEAATARTAERLRAAADLDLAGRVPYYLLVLLLTDRQARERALVVRLSDSYRMTGRVGAVTADAVLRGGIGAGVHDAAEVVDPDATVRLLFADAEAGTLRVVEGVAAAGEAAGAEEGTL
ncbi:Saccharopine dehydrogenase and related proteins [Marinactinospora thermotolerans DSM 45154]|uniref:Saccharopine dehydrogenase and related proteins n=1 Tax=Marinactinospora thermotolerans DSM 45154 TaxID=1122192 RepID=A0A1T4NJR6_9ACTN|nr:saccharopine dehydrogenase NADP-binding domain-containing protein [Marinactinospora thermotolerans]SJZ79355.1 Saccharopine dehydrogenase and related proteins [Marinactinospora thermotolerans DSM 45154]